MNCWFIELFPAKNGTFLIAGIHVFFQMSYSSDTEQLDDIMSDYISDDDDDFVIAYATLKLMDDNYDSHANKSRTVPIMPGIV
jgi:hypothetical protein